LILILLIGGVSVSDLVAAGTTFKDAKAANVHNYEIIAAGGNLLEHREFGYNSSILPPTYFVPILDLSLHGIPFTTMIADGVPVEKLTAGTAIPYLLNAGATVSEFVAAGILVSDLLEVSVTIKQLLNTGTTISDLLAVGVTDR
jgi:hypothetical protein